LQIVLEAISKIPESGSSNFNERRKSFYIDRTKAIFEMINKECPKKFMSRPRRFGKTLMLNVIKAIFEGKIIFLCIIYRQTGTVQRLLDWKRGKRAKKVVG